MNPMDRVPSLDETLRAVVSNRYLANVVRLAHEHKDQGCRGVDCVKQWVAGYNDDDGKWTKDSMWLYGEINSMSYDEMITAIPYLLRLGYSVTYWPEERDDACPFSIMFPGYAETLKRRKICRSGSIYLYSTAPGMVCLRGVLWCTPRLVRWKNRVLQAYYHPHAPGGMAHIAEGVAMVNGMYG